MARLTLVRHGQASFGAQDYDCLSALGERQAARLGHVLPKDAKVVTGAMRRHQQTAQAAAPEAAPTLDADWNEFDYLDVIGGLRPDLATQEALLAAMRAEQDPNRAFQSLYAQAMDRWAAGAHDADYTESRPAFCTRVSNAVSRLAETAHGEIVVFTSGGPIAAIVQRILGLDETTTRSIEFRLANAGLTTLSKPHKADIAAMRLITLNSFTHLEAPDDLVTYR